MHKIASTLTPVQVVDYLEECDFEYVENLIWVKVDTSNRLIRRIDSASGSAKSILLIFRKKVPCISTFAASEPNKEYKPRILHQRNADVVLDRIRPGKYLTETKPLAVYEIIETMLPDAAYQNDSRSGSCLEVHAALFKSVYLTYSSWSQHGYMRSGWVTVSQTLPSPKKEQL